MDAFRNNAQKPIYQQIREDLLMHFRETGEAQLPPERELCRRYGVCRPTVHKALSYLVENELIVRRPGKGSFFRSREDARPRIASGIKLVIRRDWKDWSGDNYFGMTRLWEECHSLSLMTSSIREKKEAAAAVAN